MADVLAALRSLMTSHSPPLDALVVPSEDYHQSEYVSIRDKRRAFVSGFTGSAGLAVITMKEALLWTDGRYFLQAEMQLSDQWKLMRMAVDPPVDTWMADNLPEEAVVGVDLWCVSVDAAKIWEGSFAKKQQKLVQTSSNLIDEVWKSRPQAEINPVVLHLLEFSGRCVADKLNDLREKLRQEKAGAVIFTTLDDVAWIYNIRGSDVPYCPVVHAFAIVTLSSAYLYVDKNKCTSEVNSFMEKNGIEVRDYFAVSTDVELLASNQLSSSPPADTKESNTNLIWVDPGTCCFALYSKLSSDKVLFKQSPVALPKALKNPVEMEGLKKAHIRDGAAVVQYLVWLDGQMKNTYGASGYFREVKTDIKEKMETRKLTEVSVSDKLEEFRASKEYFNGLSFPTISSVGPNAAIIHYKPEKKSCAELDPDSIYLFDSGAQYLDGTTDITRTVHFGVPTAHEKACYTAVLKGHIALGNAHFPSGTTGNNLDPIARLPLWKYGLDYRHGTGHGIGIYLCVHEGPHQISFRPAACAVPLQPSMTVTDEPGYYEDGNFGVRLENVLIVKEADTKFNFGDRGYLSFEHITMAPYQKKLMNLSQLGSEEIEFLNFYHSQVREKLAPYLDESEMDWLKEATEPISV
ncbi:protease [Lithospermum erythrorhizon]|uniref:Xaa-Pro aminopeptidase n=1 Tax=Lithospermum erythrorhizon TaxID=34254 RepID=A0AAV3PJ40_LITER